MDLIAKVTSKCDMACTFCAASNTDSHDLTPSEIATVANKLNANNIVILGGEPLCLPPSFYEELLSLTTAHIGITTNLKNFYLRPEAWEHIFRNERIGIATSFNYGNTRRWTKDEVYTEEMFLDVMSLFKERVGYVPLFISVLDKENVHTWRDHIELAKRLGTVCKLNNALAIGRQDEYFPRYEMFKIWTTIIDEGLEEYETNAKERKEGKCGLNTNFLCWSTIRVMQKGDDGALRFFNCDEKCNQRRDELSAVDETPIVPTREHITPMKPSCYSCELFALCNGCSVNKEQITDKETHCKEMTKLKDTLIRQGWV